MSKIKYISAEIATSECEKMLNKYYNYLIPESLSIVYLGNNILVTFLLNQTFNTEEELESALKSEPLF